MSALGHPSRACPPRGGGGLRTPAKEASLSPRDDPIRPPGFRLPPNDYVVPRLASGLTTRTHRVRPSEKISFRVNSLLSPLGHPSSDSPPRGGAGSARPRGGHWLDQGISISSTFHGTIWTKRSAGNIMSRARDRTPNRLRKRIPQ
jgi:hypothetical protein